MASDVQDKDFYNVFDGTKGRPDGSYLDMQERIEAEKLRAVQEGREPELDDIGKLPGSVGTPIVPAERQVDNMIYSNPATETLKATGVDLEVDPVETLGVDAGDADKEVDLSYAAMVANERKADDEALADDPSEVGSVTALNPEGVNTGE